MKLSDKLIKVSDSFTVNMYDNGYMIEISGRNKNDDWATAKVMCNDLETVNNIIAEAASMPRE